MLHRVLGMGALYFILGAVEGCLRVLRVSKMCHLESDLRFLHDIMQLLHIEKII